MEDRELYSGFLRLHVLHHANRGPVFGLGLIEELARHGYRISPGTLYPLLHNLEQRGYLVSAVEDVDGRRRRLYRITGRGAAALEEAKGRVRELFGELFAEE